MGSGRPHALRPGLGGAQPRFLRRLRVRAHRPGPAAQYLHGVAPLAGELEEACSPPRKRAGFRDQPRQGGRVVVALHKPERVHSGLICASRAIFVYLARSVFITSSSRSGVVPTASRPTVFSLSLTICGSPTTRLISPLRRSITGRGVPAGAMTPSQTSTV